MDIEDNLRKLGLRLPEPVAPAFQYVAVVVEDGLAWVSGQIPRDGNRILYTGKVGAEISLEQAREAARACVLQGLSQLKDALGGFERVRRMVKVTGFVASAPGFVQQPGVMDAASELLVQALGENGRHARSAVGVAELPRGVPVEVEMVISIGR
ncbi:MAG: RidA family protein [Burkholderiales bacterium]|nr:RidA family protein [Burkholderiales bacterium]